MEITKLHIEFLVLRIMFSPFINDLLHQKSRQFLLNCSYALVWVELLPQTVNIS